MEKGEIESEYSRRKKNSIFLAVSVFFVFALWAASWFVIYKIYGGHPNGGTFGDQFGAVNSLFTGLAFALLLISYRVQTQELRLQRNELENTREVLRLQIEELGITREVMKQQTRELAEQQKAMHKQRFEVTYFSLVEQFFLSRGKIRTHNHKEGVASLRFLGESAKQNKNKKNGEAEHFYSDPNNGVDAYIRLFLLAAEYLKREVSDDMEFAFYIKLLVERLTIHDGYLIQGYYCLNATSKDARLISDIGVINKLLQ